MTVLKLGVLQNSHALPAQTFVPSNHPIPNHSDEKKREVFEELLFRSLNYFLKNHHPTTGLTPDRVLQKNPRLEEVSSIAATGFGWGVLANAARNGLLPKQEAERIILMGLRTVENLDSRNGWYYHFVDMETGKRVWKCERSTIDTGWLLAGALYAAAIFPRTQIEEIAYRLFNRVNFLDPMTNGGDKPDKLTLSMGWTPEQGFLEDNWHAYAEQLLLVLLGLGASKAQALPLEAWPAIDRRQQFELPTGEKLIGPQLPLFAQEYALLLGGFRWFEDEGGLNYHDNTRRAVQFQRQIAETSGFRTYREGFKGISACDGKNGYAGFSPLDPDGTVCIGSWIAASPFDPKVADEVTSWFHGPYREEIFDEFGPVDGFNLDEDWFSPYLTGITAGADYFGSVNYLADTGLNGWRSMSDDFNQIEPVARGIERSGMRKVSA